MMRARITVTTLGALALAACSVGDPSNPGLTVGSVTVSTTGEDGSTTTADPSTGGSGGGSETGGPASADSNTDTSSADSTSGGGGSSTGDPCVPGTEGCPCDAGTCEGELLCLGDVCQAPQCDGDVFEPNDDEASATFLGDIDDSDSSGGVVSASLHHPGDVDWFRYQGDDDITGDVDPARELAASAGLRMCKFLECDNGLGQTEFECPVGTDYALSPSARPGCCVSGATGEIQLPDLNCTGVIEDNAAVYIRLDQPDEACVSYSASYHY